MFKYVTLENIDIETIHDTFTSAFSDYQVKIDLPLWKFQNMLQRRGYGSDISIGAFNEQHMVGFVLNGVRKWDGMPTVYDMGTGIVSAYRKQGITTSMLSNIKEVLKEKGITHYLLEVIQSNTSAVQLYTKQGFEITRRFACFQLDKPSFRPMTTYKVEHLEKFDEKTWHDLIDFWDFLPSWQNSVDSVNAVPDAFVYAVVRLEDTLVGYGIIDKRTGDIPQIAVSKLHRRQGIARSILSDLVQNTESNKISLINVDDASTITMTSLQALGFENVISQYEMILKF